MQALTRRAAVALGAAGFAAMLVPQLRAQPVRTVADTMAGDTRFTRFMDMITRATAVEDFRQAAPITVFAPVDAAFAAAPAGVMQEILGRGGSGSDGNTVERQRVLSLIRNHIVPGLLGQAELQGSERRFQTASGGDLVLSMTNGVLTVRNPTPPLERGAFAAAGLNVAPLPAQLAGSAITACDGIIYPVSQILWS